MKGLRVVLTEATKLFSEEIGLQPQKVGLDATTPLCLLFCGVMVKRKDIWQSLL